MTTTPQAALLSEAAKLADELDHEASKRACNVAMMPASLPVDAAKELRRLDALVAHLTADRDDTANELALRTKHNLALTNERDQLLAKLQATQEPVQAGELPPLPFPNDHNGFGRCPDRYTADQMYAYARAALSARKPLPYDLICNAIDLADTESMNGDYMLESGDCIAVVRTMQALIEINGIGLEVKP